MGFFNWQRLGQTLLLMAAVVATVFSCASNAKSSSGPKIKNVAVVEAEVDAESDASASLNKAEVRQITAVLRKEAVKNLPQEKYNIMTTETVMSQGSAVLEECSDENCVIKVGAAIGADYIVRGTVSKFGNMLTVSVDMYETNDGNLVASSELVRSENIVELLDKAAGASGEMYRKFENPSGFVPKQEQPTVNTTPAASQYQPNQSQQYSSTQDGNRKSKEEVEAKQQRLQELQAQRLQIEQKISQRVGQQAFANSGSVTLTDNRNGKTYKTVVIGGKRWMAENLNYQTSSGSKCYRNDKYNCDQYGRLYGWNTAKTVCPARFHLPSSQEWGNLVEAVGADACKKLQAPSGWANNNIFGNGTNAFGFSALPGGFGNPRGDFVLAGEAGFWWTATEINGSDAYRWGMAGNIVSERDSPKHIAYSVRCVADN